MCLGKTFAELTLKFTIPMYTYFFDFEYVNEEHKQKRPLYQFASPSMPEIPIYFKIKNRVEFEE